MGPHSNVVRNIRLLLSLRGMSQATLANAIHVHPIHLNKLLNGKCKFSIAHAESCAMSFGIAAHTLFFPAPEFDAILREFSECLV